MELLALKKSKRTIGTKNTFYLQSFGGQNFNPHLIALPFINTY
jgi:hypothetical protein